MQTWQGEGGRGIPKHIPYLVKRGTYRYTLYEDGGSSKFSGSCPRDSWGIGPFHSGNKSYKTCGNEPWYTFQSRTVQSRTFQSQDGSVPHFSVPRRFSPGSYSPVMVISITIVYFLSLDSVPAHSVTLGDGKMTYHHNKSWW